MLIKNNLLELEKQIIFKKSFIWLQDLPLAYLKFLYIMLLFKCMMQEKVAIVCSWYMYVRVKTTNKLQFGN